MSPVRVYCPSPALAAALAEYLDSEGHASMWWAVLHRAVLITVAPLAMVNRACLGCTANTLTTVAL